MAALRRSQWQYDDCRKVFPSNATEASNFSKSSLNEISNLSRCVLNCRRVSFACTMPVGPLEGRDWAFCKGLLCPFCSQDSCVYKSGLTVGTLSAEQFVGC